MLQIRFTPKAEFVDRSGKVRRIPGCSAAGRFEFSDRLEQIKAAIDAHQFSEKPWRSLYDDDPFFRSAVDECLKLNGIDPGWVTLDQVEQLLFCRPTDGGTFDRGWLLEINDLKRPDRTPDQQADATLIDLITLVSLITDSFATAVEVLEAMSIEQIEQLFEARTKIENQGNKMAEPPANFEELMSAPVGKQVRI